MENKIKIIKVYSSQNGAGDKIANIKCTFVKSNKKNNEQATVNPFNDTVAEFFKETRNISYFEKFQTLKKHCDNLDEATRTDLYPLFHVGSRNAGLSAPLKISAKITCDFEIMCVKTGNNENTVIVFNCVGEKFKKQYYNAGGKDTDDRTQDNKLNITLFEKLLAQQQKKKMFFLNYWTEQAKKFLGDKKQTALEYLSRFGWDMDNLKIFMASSLKPEPPPQLPAPPPQLPAPPPQLPAPSAQLPLAPNSSPPLPAPRRPRLNPFQNAKEQKNTVPLYVNKEGVGHSKPSTSEEEAEHLIVQQPVAPRQDLQNSSISRKKERMISRNAFDDFFPEVHISGGAKAKIMLNSNETIHNYAFSGDMSCSGRSETSGDDPNDERLEPDADEENFKLENHNFMSYAIPILGSATAVAATAAVVGALYDGVKKCGKNICAAPFPVEKNKWTEGVAEAALDGGLDGATKPFKWVGNLGTNVFNGVLGAGAAWINKKQEQTEGESVAGNDRGGNGEKLNLGSEHTTLKRGSEKLNLGSEHTTLKRGSENLANGYRLYVSGEHANPNIIFNKNVVHTSPNGTFEENLFRELADAKPPVAGVGQEAQSGSNNTAFNDIFSNRAYESMTEAEILKRQKLWMCGINTCIFTYSYPEYPEEPLSKMTDALFKIPTVTQFVETFNKNGNFDLIGLNNYCLRFGGVNELDDDLLYVVNDFYVQTLTSQKLLNVLSGVFASLVVMQERMDLIAEAKPKKAKSKPWFKKGEKGVLYDGANKAFEEEKVRVRVRVTTVNGHTVVGERVCEKPLIVQSDDGETIAFQSEIKSIEFV